MLIRGLVKAAKIAIDLSVLAVAYALAFAVRFEGALSGEAVRALVVSLPAVLIVKVVCLAVLRIPTRTWRYVSLYESQLLLLALSVATALLMVGKLTLAAPLGLVHVPLGVLLIDLGLGLLGTVGVRVAFRRWTERRAGRAGHAGKRVAVPTLLIGVGRVGAAVARELGADAHPGIRPIGFLGEDASMVGLVIHGIPVLGTVEQLEHALKRYAPRQVLITLDCASVPTVRGIVRSCEGAGVSAKVIPPTGDLMAGRVNLATIRDVAIEDVLRRPPVNLDRGAIASMLQCRRVLVTGAGGSIGSELCREVCRFRPDVLVLVEQAENALFHVHRALTQEFPEVRTVPCVADVLDAGRMDLIFARHRPQLVLHAAAHKHVPMMEANPGEAVKNNVLGTRTLADLADAHGVGVFVMISTDKAVNPTSVMGVSKRVAEVYVQALAHQSDTRFVAVRFGNVLGSNGSVVPIFREQIARGGPVTVTHPEMRRYFMTIPEACQLVLQAATMGGGGEIFILDMGEPVKVLDLAKDMIRLSGLSPDEIAITFTGVRPGEKLFEELALASESALKTKHPRIFIGRLQAPNWREINHRIDELGQLAVAADPGAIRAKFKEIVPEYHLAPPESSAPAARERVRADEAGERGGARSGITVRPGGMVPNYG
jgi:FlaA1/EpsC-like NDP-sugar epimerase